DPLAVGIGGHVVDRRQVEEVVHVAAKPLDVLVHDPQPPLGQVPHDPHDPVVANAPVAPELLQSTLRPLAHEHVDGTVALEQQLDQATADEAGRPGDEVAHDVPPETTPTVLHTAR